MDQSKNGWWKKIMLKPRTYQKWCKQRDKKWRKLQLQKFLLLINSVRTKHSSSLYVLFFPNKQFWVFDRKADQEKRLSLLLSRPEGCQENTKQNNNKRKNPKQAHAFLSEESVYIYSPKGGLFMPLLCEMHCPCVIVQYLILLCLRMTHPCNKQKP